MDIEQLPKACVILGAGASHDVAGQNAGRAIPPLANELFSDVYSERILRRYPEARFLASRLESIVLEGEQAIEDALREDKEHSDETIRQKFKEIPAYLRDLIFAACELHKGRPDPHIELVRRLLSDRPHQVLFIVLNYDDLLEIALRQYSSDRFHFSSVTSYFTDLQAKVIQMHGSINWFRRINLQSEQTKWGDEVLERDVFRDETFLDPDRLVHIQRGIEDSRQIQRYDNGKPYLIYPMVTAPVAGKTIDDIDCPVPLLEGAQRFLNDCNKFLIIGTSGLDGDLFELLNRGLKKGSPAPLVHVVGVDKVEAFDRFQKGVVEFRGRLDPADSKFNDGFYQYAFGKGLDRFVSRT